jgi:proteasome lid subunit RPN8/RPN11
MNMFSRWFAKLFPIARTYRITREARKAMQAFSQTTHPKEAFGVLTGRTSDGTLVIDSVIYQPFTNTTHSAHAKIDQYAVNGLIGTFHSHPIHDATPSSADKQLFRHYAGLHCIVPYPYKVIYVYRANGELLDAIAV